MPNSLDQQITEILSGLEEARTRRMRDEAALGALQNEERRLLAEAQEKFSCKSLAELQAEAAKVEQTIRAIIKEAEDTLNGSVVF